MNHADYQDRINQAEIALEMEQERAQALRCELEDARGVLERVAREAGVYLAEELRGEVEETIEQLKKV